MAVDLGCKLKELDNDATLATAFDNYGGPEGGFCKFLARAMARPDGFATLNDIARAPAIFPSADAETNRQARSLDFLRSIGAPIAAAALPDPGFTPGLGCQLHDLDKDDILLTAYENYGGPQGGFYKFLNRALVRPGGFATLETIVRDPDLTTHARSLTLLQSIGAPIAAAALHANAVRSPSPAESSGSSGSSTASHTLTRQRADAASTPSSPKPALWVLPQAPDSAAVDAADVPDAAGSTCF